MSRRVVKFQQTPNPSAIKCVLDRAVAPAPRSYFDAAAAAGDPLAAALFAIDGVTNVLIHGEWITVCKRPETPWNTVKTGVQRVLAEAEEETERPRDGETK